MMETQEIQRDEPMKLYVQECGPATAPTLVLLHGGGVGGWMWEKHVAALEGEYHLLVPDLPEHGQSAEVAPFTILEAARRLAALIHQRAHGGRAHLAGLSLGGQVGVALLGLSPTLVDRAVLSGVLAQRPGGGRGLLQGLLGPMLRLYAPFKDNPRLIRANMQSLGVPEVYYEQFAADTRRTTAVALGHILEANQRFELPPGLTRRQTPTLLLVGEKEPGVMKRSARALAGSMLGGTARMVPGAVHNWPLTQPELFVTVVRAWLTDGALPEALVPVPRR